MSQSSNICKPVITCTIIKTDSFIFGHLLAVLFRPVSVLAETWKILFRSYTNGVVAPIFYDSAKGGLFCLFNWMLSYSYCRSDPSQTLVIVVMNETRTSHTGRESTCNCFRLSRNQLCHTDVSTLSTSLSFSPRPSRHKNMIDLRRWDESDRKQEMHCQIIYGWAWGTPRSERSIQLFPRGEGEQEGMTQHLSIKASCRQAATVHVYTPIAEFRWIIFVDQYWWSVMLLLLLL